MTGDIVPGLMEMSAETADFIREHRNDDVRRLALGHHPAGVDIRTALVQISGYQAALEKLPEWAATDGVLWPPHLSMEQCTSQILAQYKSSIVSELLDPGFPLADLTGGLGADCLYLSKRAGAVFYNELNPELCALAQHNLPLLGCSRLTVSNTDAESFIASHSCDRFGLLYIDPARRSAAGHRLVSLKDCQPDVTLLQDRMTAMADFVMVKMSPMLDIRVALSELRNVRQLWALSLCGECKELLAVLDSDFSGETEILAVNVNADGTCSETLRSTLSAELRLPLPTVPEDRLVPGTFLYEPFPAYMKSGLYRTMCLKYGVRQLSADSHLFFSDIPVPSFPGRGFRISSVVQSGRRQLGELFSRYPQANIAVRNFPMTVDEIRRRYKVRDGGTCYMFASTSADGKRLVFVTERV